MQEILEVAAEDISQNAGVAWNGAQISEPMTEAAAWAYAEAFVRKKTAALPIQNLSLMQSQLLKDGKTIDLIAHYQVRMPFPVLRVRAVEQTNRSFRYAWTGLDGPVDGAGGRQDADEAVVYVGRDSTRYHVSRSCHYLSTELKAVSYADLEATAARMEHAISPVTGAACHMGLWCISRLMENDITVIRDAVHWRPM